MERRSCAAGSVVTSRPSTVMVPDVGSTIRLIIRREVVLPQPEGPTKTVMAPLSMDMLRSSTAAWPPWYVFVTLWNSIMASAITGLPNCWRQHGTVQPTDHMHAYFLL